MRHPSITLLIPLVAACAHSAAEAGDTTEDDVTGIETTTAETDDTGDIPEADPAELCEETDLEVIVPWAGPGVTDTGELGPLTREDYTLHSTWAIPSPGKEQEFLTMAVAVIGAAQGIPGLVAISASRSERCGSLRTIGIWESPMAMFQLLATPEHASAVTRAAEVSTTGKTTSWAASADEARALEFEVGRAKLAQVPTSPAYD